MSDNEVKPVYLTDNHIRILLDIIKEREDFESSRDIDKLVELGREYKKLSGIKYPKDEFEIWVDEETRRLEMRFPKCDHFWNNVKIAELIIAYHDQKKESVETLKRRIYI